MFDEDVIVPVVFMTFVFLAVCLKILVNARRSGSLGNRRLDDEEARLMQDMNRELERIEQRVEALETILLETTSARTKGGTSPHHKTAQNEL